MLKWKQTGEGWYIQILVNYLSLVFWKGHQSAKYLMVHLWVRFPDGGLLNQRVNTCVILLAAVIQSLSCIRLFATPWTIAFQASLSFTISWSLLKLMSIESMMPSNHLILCPLLLLPSIFPSIRVFPNESALCRWPKTGGQSFARCCQTPSRFCAILHFYWQWFESIEGILFSPCHMACGILAPWPELEPGPPALEAWSHNHWTIREVPRGVFLISLKYNDCYFSGSISFLLIVFVQSPRPVQLFVTPWTAAHQACLSLTTFWSLLKFMSIVLVMPPSHLILWFPFLLLPSVFLSIRVFSSGVCSRWPKYGNFSILPMSIQGWFPLGLTGLISLLSKELSRVFSSITVWKHQFFSTMPSLPSGSQNCSFDRKCQSHHRQIIL